MIVGFTITDLKGYRDAAIEYIRKVCILESPEIASNIVDSGVGVNVYSSNIDRVELSRQPFSTRAIETINGKVLLISTVNFNLELLYNGRILRLYPTQYAYILVGEVPQFTRYIQQGLVTTIPLFNEENKQWLLSSGRWNDANVWVDTDFWRDN